MDLPYFGSTSFTDANGRKWVASGHTAHGEASASEPRDPQRIARPCDTAVTSMRIV